MQYTVAQLGEHRAHDAKVDGSIPFGVKCPVDTEKQNFLLRPFIRTKTSLVGMDNKFLTFLMI